MKLTPIQIWQNVLKKIGQRELAETDSIVGSEYVDQPGHNLRKVLRYYTEARAGFRQETPVTRINNEREGD